MGRHDILPGLDVDCGKSIEVTSHNFLLDRLDEAFRDRMIFYD
jgi:hypothetical protein